MTARHAPVRGLSSCTPALTTKPGQRRNRQRWRRRHGAAAHAAAGTEGRARGRRARGVLKKVGVKSRHFCSIHSPPRRPKLPWDPTETSGGGTTPDNPGHCKRPRPKASHPKVKAAGDNGVSELARAAGDQETDLRTQVDTSVLHWSHRWTRVRRTSHVTRDRLGPEEPRCRLTRG